MTYRKMQQKKGRKIKPGEMVVTLEENKENENVPGPSGLQRREVVIWDKERKSVKNKKKFQYQES